LWLKLNAASATILSTNKAEAWPEIKGDERALKAHAGAVFDAGAGVSNGLF
jgi:hypothetical protein